MGFNSGFKGLILALECRWWLASCFGRFIPEDSAPSIDWTESWVGLGTGLNTWEKRKTFACIGNRTTIYRLSSPQASHYTDWAILAPTASKVCSNNTLGRLRTHRRFTERILIYEYRAWYAAHYSTEHGTQHTTVQSMVRSTLQYRARYAAHYSTEYGTQHTTVQSTVRSTLQYGVSQPLVFFHGETPNIFFISRGPSKYENV